VEFAFIFCYASIMVKTSFLDIPDELKFDYDRTLEQRDRFTLGVVQGHKRLLSRRERKLLKRPAVINSPMEGRGSLFKYLSPLWRALTLEQKNAWKNAGVYSNLTNWQLFISDNAARIRHSLPLEVPPSELWQVRAGQLKIESPASELVLQQQHPLDYWGLQKIRGRSWKSELVLIREALALPLELAIRYKSDLEEISSPEWPSEVPRVARYFASVWVSYQGQETRHEVEIPFALTSDWTLETVTLAPVLGVVVSYILYLEIKGYRGTILFDNIRAIHSGQNWARDPRCDEINKTFKKAFAVVPPFWVPVSLPLGSSFASYYPPALA
jgi:hypothetical protein